MGFNEIDLRRIERVVGGFCNERIPEYLRARVKVFYEVQGNEIRIVESRAFQANGHKRTDTPVAKLKYDPTTMEWNLFWHRASDKWVSYYDLKPARDLKSLISVIQDDPFGLFWGRSMTCKPRVLVIDQSELIRGGLKLHLGSRFDVITVSSASDALIEFMGMRFDLILTDVIIPAMTGFGTISALRQQHPGIPIIAMSGWGKSPQGDELKADTVLLKPFDLGELDRALDKLLMHRIS